MSGRLTILPKKTYCPWKQENIERVLRDERLERERIEKESSDVAKHKQQQRLQHDRGRRDGDDGRGDGDANSNDEESNKEKGHINLFPEAKEAELRLTHTTSLPTQQQHNNNGKVDESGIEPIPLGGNESINRKVGNVPFYMRSTTAATNASTGGIGSSTTSNGNNNEKYENTNNSFRLGNRKPNNHTISTGGDAITNKIMQDQYIQREDYRKRNMDPMNRFYVDSVDKEAGVYANNDVNSTSFKPTDNNDTKIQSLHDIKDKKHKKKKRKRRSYSSDSSTTSSSVDRDRHKKKRRKHKSKKKKRSKNRDCRDHHRHDKNRDDETELQELRRRRHAREANERDRLNNSRGGDDASSSFDGSTIQTKDGRCYDGSNGFH